MLDKFQKHINKNFPFIKEKKLLVAISGGVDSVVLTHLLCKLELNITLAHCNFQLRGKESDEDEQFVIDLAKKLSIKVYTKQFKTKVYAANQKLSIQMAARELRYNWFDELIRKKGLDYILTAHQQDDNLETVLINFSRGTGLDGLIGIPEKNSNILRPLLVFSRAEIEKYAECNDLSWREDKSNSDIKYDRNKIRHKIVPILKELNPSLMNSFQKSLEYLNQSQNIIDDSINNIKQEVITYEKDVIKIDIEEIKKLSNPKAYLYQVLKEYNFTEWNDVERLLEAQPGKQLFSKTHRLIKDRDHFLLESIQTNNNTHKLIIEKDQKLLDTEAFSIYVNQTQNELSSFNNDYKILVDGDLIEYPLILRRWNKGDYFYPFGMQGKKKLSKFFKDEKLSLLDKKNIWILSSNNRIVWVIGKRLDNRFKLTEHTKKIVQIEYIKK